MHQLHRFDGNLIPFGAKRADIVLDRPGFEDIPLRLVIAFFIHQDDRQALAVLQRTLVFNRLAPVVELQGVGQTFFKVMFPNLVNPDSLRACGASMPSR